jgi:hypothetical protein
VKPGWPDGFGPTFETLNVDGGVTNNSPSQLVHDYLAARNPNLVDGHNPREPLQANCAVLTVAPFPAEDKFNGDFDPRKVQGLWPVLGKLFGVLISQSRFLGESLEVLASGESFSRFAIAPSDQSQGPKDALQCGKLGAFGGFFERGFRAHDFLLGRRNCQRFLLATDTRTSHFSLPLANPIIQAGMQQVGTHAAQILTEFQVNPPIPAVQPQGAWMPLIPLCGSACAEVKMPDRAKIQRHSVDQILNLIVARVKYIKSDLLKGAPGELAAVADVALAWPLVELLKSKLRDKLLAGLAPDVVD